MQHGTSSRKVITWYEIEEYVTETWRYVKTGTCDFCPNDDARLYTLRDLKGLRVVVPPLFCLDCRKKYEKGALTLP